MGIDDATAEAAGITAYKVAMVWPLDVRSFLEWAEGLDLIIVVEEKRKVIEGQIKEALFNDRHRPREFWVGKTTRERRFFPARVR